MMPNVASLRTCLRVAATVFAYSGACMAGCGVGLALVSGLYRSRLEEALSIAAGLSFTGAALIAAAKVLARAVPPGARRFPAGFEVMSRDVRGGPFEP
jgi:hypothetical protein